MLQRGRVDHIDGSTGELIHRYTTVHEPGGLLPVACKTRRASRCAPCAEVAEYQRRGVVHFHAIVRLDGPAGPTTAPPTWAALALLTDAIGQAARAVRMRTPAAPRIPSRTLAWGGQLDIRPVTSAGVLTDTTVAGYVANYVACLVMSRAGPAGELALARAVTGRVRAT